MLRKHLHFRGKLFGELQTRERERARRRGDKERNMKSDIP